jgi:hypothetical protein
LIPIAAAVQPTALVLRDLAMFLLLTNQLNASAAELPSALLLGLEQALLASFLSAHRRNFSKLLEGTAKEAGRELYGRPRSILRHLGAAPSRSRSWHCKQTLRYAACKKGRGLLWTGAGCFPVSSIADFGYYLGR